MQNNSENPVDLVLSLLSTGKITEQASCYRQILHDVENLKPALVQQFCIIEDEARQRIFIRNFHARLVYLHDYFFEMTEKNNPEKPKIQDIPVKNPGLLYSHRSVLPVLDDLLVFVRERFSSWCSERQKIPERLRLSFTSEILEKMEALSFPLTDPEHALFEKVKESVRYRLTEGHAVITYGLTNYLHAFLEAVNMIRTGKREHPLLTTLTDILIAANFNAISVMEDLTARIREEVEKIGSAKEQIEHLNGWLKKIDQVPVSLVCKLDEQTESLSLFLCKWIEAEILFHEKSLQLFSDPFYPSGFSGIPGGSKLDVDLSVAQMSCLLRLLKECAIIKSGKIMELFGFLALHFRSKKQENISAESVRQQFYHVTESTREEVRKVILRLLKKVSSPL